MEHSVCPDFSPDLISLEVEVIDNTNQKQENDVENVTKVWSRARRFFFFFCFQQIYVLSECIESLITNTSCLERQKTKHVI